MVVDPKQATPISHLRVEALSDYLRKGDLLLVNVASTLPSSFFGTVIRTGMPIEVRLAAFRGGSARDLSSWSALTFGSGDWRVPTEKRGPPPEIRKGDVIRVSPSLSAEILEVCPRAPRFLNIQFSSNDLIRELYREGRPIQYSYLEKELELWDQQTLFNGPPVAVEPPSAAFPLTWSLVLALQSKGVKLATVIHSAGISSTGSPELDALLPLEEFYEVPKETLAAIDETSRSGSRVVALGTSVTRAVESALRTGKRTGLTSFKLGPKNSPKVVDILITGMHEEGSSHGELMKAFCNCSLLRLAQKEATGMGYLSHEYGDITVLNCGNSVKDV